MSNQYGPKIVTDGLVLCLDAGNTKSYPGSGTLWTDLSGNGNNGTLTNGPTYSGANTGGVVLDGIDDYINVTENANMKPQVLTIEVVIKINSTTNTTIISPNTFQYILFRQNSRIGNFEGYNVTYGEPSSNFGMGATPIGGTPQYNISMPGGTSPVGSINFISAVFDTSSMRLYQNGILGASGVKANGIDYNNTHTLKIGRTVPVGATFDASANATIYSVKMYNRALSAIEILQNYNATKGRYNL